MDDNNIAENIKRIREKIAHAAAAAGRRESDIQLMAVTKTVGTQEILKAVSAGLRLLGENRVQELLTKYDVLHDAGAQIHLIGHLQSNKVSKVIGRGDDTIGRFDSDCGGNRQEVRAGRSGDGYSY